MAPAIDKVPLLIESGREVAGSFLEKAVTEADTVEQMHNGIYMFNRASMHILAMTVYNDERLGGLDPETQLQEIFTEIRKELEFIKECEHTEQLDLFTPRMAH